MLLGRWQGIRPDKSAVYRVFEIRRFLSSVFEFENIKQLRMKKIDLKKQWQIILNLSSFRINLRCRPLCRAFLYVFRVPLNKIPHAEKMSKIVVFTRITFRLRLRHRKTVFRGLRGIYLLRLFTSLQPSLQSKKVRASFQVEPTSRASERVQEEVNHMHPDNRKKTSHTLRGIEPISKRHTIFRGMFNAESAAAVGKVRPPRASPNGPEPVQVSGPLDLANDVRPTALHKTAQNSLRKWVRKEVAKGGNHRTSAGEGADVSKR